MMRDAKSIAGWRQRLWKREQADLLACPRVASRVAKNYSMGTCYARTVDRLKRAVSCCGGEGTAEPGDGRTVAGSEAPLAE